MLVLVLSVFLTAACEDRNAADAPPPQEPTRAATGYYCNMTVIEHPGPKGHIFLKDQSEPIWFSSVRDTIAFTMLPEEAKDIAAIYVNDMAVAKTWEQPEAGAWVRAHEAWYVIGSGRRGGMGAPEAVPFGSRDAAAAFAGMHGGEIIAFKDIPEDAILGNVMESMESGHSGHQQADGADTEHGTVMEHGDSGHGSHEQMPMDDSAHGEQHQ